MSRNALTGAAVALAAVAGVVLAGVAVNELNYAADHPFRYGPAKVIATAAGAGTVLAIAVVALALAASRSR